MQVTFVLVVFRLVFVLGVKCLRSCEFGIWVVFLLRVLIICITFANYLDLYLRLVDFRGFWF